MIWEPCSGACVCGSSCVMDERHRINSPCRCDIFACPIVNVEQQIIDVEDAVRESCKKLLGQELNDIKKDELVADMKYALEKYFTSIKPELEIDVVQDLRDDTLFHISLKEKPKEYINVSFVI